MARTIVINEINPLPEGTYEVCVTEDDSMTTHTVHVNGHYIEELGKKPEEVQELLKESFEFLLYREPKESIHRDFNLKVIAKYFPEYESQMRGL